MLSNKVILNARSVLKQLFQQNNRAVSYAILNKKINPHELLIKSENCINKQQFYIQNKLIHIKSFDYKKNSKTTSTDKDENETDQEDYEDDDDNDENDEFNKIVKNIDTSKFPKGYKIVSKSVASLRIDAVLAVGVSMSRNKLDEQFYGSKLKINGLKVLKKAMKVNEGDVLDLTMDKDKDGNTLIKRVILHKILETKTQNKKQKVVLIVWKGGIKVEDNY